MAEWAGRVLAVLFASAVPVERAVLAQVIGRDVAVESVLEAVRRTLDGGSIEVARVGSAWMLRTRREYADAVRAALGESATGATEEDMTEHEISVLAAIAYFQPVSRADLGEIFGQEPGDAILNRLRTRDLIAAGPRVAGRGAAHTFVTTPMFLATFGFEDLQAFTDEAPGLGEGHGRLGAGLIRRD